jgi:4-hydroxyphenylpyruvate dioxygenase
MSDLLLHPEHAREPLQDSFSDEANPIGLDGIEFIEYATSKPQALGHVLEMMGFRPVARHRSREVLLYRQGGLNVVVNAHPVDGVAAPLTEVPVISAVAFRVRDARAAYRRVLDLGGWEVPTHPEAMELNIPAIHGPAAAASTSSTATASSRSTTSTSCPIPTVDQHPPAVAGIHFFGVVQYIGAGRSLRLDRVLRGAVRPGADPRRAALRHPALGQADARARPRAANALHAAADRTRARFDDGRERLQRIGLGVPDVLAAVQALRARGMEFVETEAAHTERRGAISKTYLGGVVFELVHDEAAA